MVGTLGLVLLLMTVSTVYHPQSVTANVVGGDDSLVANVYDDNVVGANTYPPYNDRLGIQGDVYVKPWWIVRESFDSPVAFQVILDVSGPMSWSLEGYGTYEGGAVGRPGDYQCENPDNTNPRNFAYLDRCYGGLNSSWRILEERRIYAAKQSVLHLIEQMDANDVMQVIAFSADNPAFGYEDVAVYPEEGMIGDKAQLRQLVINAGRYTGDPYRTVGATPGAAAFREADVQWEQWPENDPAGDEYELATVFITGSATNVFLDGMVNTARDVCNDISPQQALHTPDPCQIGVTGDGRLRPLIALINEATKVRQNQSELDIYAISLGEPSALGLSQIVPQDRLYQVNELSDIEPIIETIYNSTDSSEESCRIFDGTFTSRIVEEHIVDNPADFGLPNRETFGYVYLFDQNGVPLPEEQHVLPIQCDLVRERLTYSLSSENGLAPGHYQMSSFIAYKGFDGVSRRYDHIVDVDNPEGSSMKPFVVERFVPGGVFDMSPLLIDLSPSFDLCAEAD